ncbi:unnamed protein product [Pylaiella littoralis]
MSKSMAAATFHKFCKNFAKEMFEEHIYLPTGTYQDEVMDCYRKLGFTGAIGSTDVTHVGWGMCPFTLGRSFTGKEGFQPWRSRLLSTTRAAPLASPKGSPVRPTTRRSSATTQPYRPSGTTKCTRIESTSSGRRMARSSPGKDAI